jgi:chromosome segregation ATPase
MMELELQNIGGFTGVHTFEIKKGINRITAPNAKGKSSLLRGIQCLASDDETVFRDSLNDDNDTGSIKLDDEFVRNLRRTNNIVQATPADDRTFFDENSQWRNAEKIAFFTPKSRVVLEIEQNMFDVLRFVKSVSGAEIVESDLRRKEAQLEDAKQKLDEYIENLTNAQKLEAEIKTMQGDIQKLQDEVQELEDEIAKESGTMDITDVSKDLATKKREITGLHERLRVREGEVKRYQDEYEKAHALRERIDEEIAEFERTYESPEKSIEEFKGNISKYERRKKSLKKGKDLVDSLLGVINEAYKM